MAREIDMKELRDLVMEEVEKVEKSLEKVKAKEVKPDGYADTLENPVDWEKELGIDPSTSKKEAMLETLRKKESKAVRVAKAFRAQRLALQEQMEKDSLVAENKRLKAAIAKVKKTK